MQARLEDDAQCLLVIIGATPEGKKELVGLIDGVRESAQSWKELLLDLKRRGLAMGPELAVADGALGFWKALPEVWPRTREQRCWVHKTANVPQQAAEEPPRQGRSINTNDARGDAFANLGNIAGSDFDDERLIGDNDNNDVLALSATRSAAPPRGTTAQRWPWCRHAAAAPTGGFV